MVETSLEAVAVSGAALLSDAFAPVPSPSDRGFLNSSPVCTENPICVDDVMESPKLAE
jgi:hypothetical protein